ncbi:MAG: DUF6079 family protein [Gemmatimonadota bacterium]|nr:DUF6079 family protein [Gemmatimonadota bacterium]
MRYGDLVQFEPLESIIQLRDADRAEAARRLVSTFVISGEMAERLTALVIPNLQFERPADNKGLLIVGNYGTGKSHLMSVLSAVAEHAELAAQLTHPAVSAAAEAIAGRFQVVRTELGATTMDLREFVCSELERALARLEIEYRFPPRDRIPNHKAAFEELMALFQERFPEQGLLFVVDELLDYLRSRRDADLILDLNFLREIGEIARDLRFRFVAGVQEMLFDNPRFQFVADTLLRVKDRFEQVRIAQKDVKYVVAERLLRKTVDQQARIREHLLPFVRFYGEMGERLEEYVRLFPIHPDYLAVFESISFLEKRHALKTLSLAMRDRLEQVVPEEAPGLIAYDSYWLTLRENPSFRAVPEIREVIDVSQALEARIERGFSRPAYRPLALRIIAGLSVHRLTVGDIHAPVGATPEELRDGLCLFDPLVAELGGDPADDLLSQVEMVLQEIHRTLSGQFLSHNPDNRQYYLDLRKTEDFDALIEKRAESLDSHQTDRAFFDALRRVLLERAEQTPHVSGFRIWEYELLWQGHGTTRRGYLFFGGPDERSTAAPPRDFYLYFLRPDEPLPSRTRREPDELFFRMTGADAELRRLIHHHAAALDLAATASGQRKAVYQKKAEEALHQLTGWLRRNLGSACEVTHQGRTRPLLDWVQGSSVRQRLGLAANERAGARDLVNLVASICLAPHWEDQAPEYPRFTSTPVTEENRARLAQEALRGIGGTRTRQAASVLEALELLDGERVDPGRSRYAAHVIERLASRGQGQVLNREELLQPIDGVEYLAPERFRLEAELAVVVLAALVYSGDVVLTAAGRKFDAASMEQLVATSVEVLAQFRHLEPPREWNLPGLKSLFELVGLEPGLAHAVTLGRGEPVGRLLPAAGALVNRLVRTEQQLQGGLPLWGRPLLTDAERAARRARLEEARLFLESLQAFSSPGRLKNFRTDPAQLRAYRATLETLREMEALGDFTTELQPLAAYLSHAETLLPEEHRWTARMREVRDELLARITTPTGHGEPGGRQRMIEPLAELKREYIQAYAAEHARTRLGVAEDRRKQALLRDPRLEQLRRLAAIDLMHREQLLDYQQRLTELQSCFALTERELDASPLCPHCAFRPAVERAKVSGAQRLDELDDALDVLYASWTAALLEALRHPSAQESRELLASEARASIEEILRSGELPQQIGDDLIASVRQVLSGLEKVVLRTDELRAALLEGGSPATSEELRRRFERFLAQLSRGKPADRVRVVVE